MKWFNNLKFRWKLILPITFLGFGLVVVALIGMNQISKVSSNAFVLGDEYMPSLGFLLEADRDLQQALVAERSLIFLATNSDKYQGVHDAHAENITQAEQRSSNFFKITQSATAKAKQKEFTELFNKWKDISVEVVRQRTEEGRRGRNTAIELSFNEAALAFEQMRDVIDKLTEQLLIEASSAAEDAHTSGANSMTILGTSLIIGLIFCVIVGVFFPKMIVCRLQKLNEAINHLASGDGDLTLRSDISSDDELGDLSRSMNTFLDKLHSLISQLASTSDKVQQSSVNLLKLNEETQAIVNTQHNSTDSVASAMNEMSETVNEVAQNAESAADAARQADSGASEGQSLVNDSAESIRSLAHDVDKAAEVINTLEKESESVGSVLDVIRGIAEQTNLLALNAAIEAARAGEQGRGFAVVADEVRTLASRTQQSTEEIQEMIERLLHGSRNAVKVMESGRKNAQISVERAESAGSSIIEITKSVALMNEMNSQIAHAAKEQSTVTGEINNNISEISAMSDNTANISSKASKSSLELSQYAQELDDIVKNFTI